MFHFNMPLIEEIEFGAEGNPKCVDAIMPGISSGGVVRSGRAVADTDTERLTFEDLVMESLERLKDLGVPYRLWKKGDDELKMMESSDSKLNVDPKNDPLFIMLIASRSSAPILFDVDGSFSGLFDKREHQHHYYWEVLVSQDRVQNKAEQKDKLMVNIKNCYSAAIFVRNVVPKVSPQFNGPDEYKPEQDDDHKKMHQWFCHSYMTKAMIVKSIKERDEKHALAAQKQSQLDAPGAKELIETLKNELTSYLNKTNPQPKGGIQKYGQHLKFFKTKSRVTNSEANHRLAQKIYDMLDQGSSIQDTFDDIKKLRNDTLTKDMKLNSKQIAKLTPGIHSTDLKKIIKKAERYIQSSEQLESKSGRRKPS